MLAASPFISHQSSLFFYLVTPLTCNSSLSCDVSKTTIIADSWGTAYTGGIEKSSADRNIRKILNVSHFYLEFS